MNWIRDNKTLAAILGFMGAGVVGLGIWLYISYANYAAAAGQYTEVRQDVTGLQRSKPTPNPENVEGKTGKVKEFQDKVDNLRGVLESFQRLHDITPIAENDFQARLKAHINAMKQQAATARVTLPEGFAFAFDEYTASLPKTPENAAELNLHLDVIEKLVSVLVESGIKQLDKLERTKLPFEQSAANTPSYTPPPVKTNPKGAKKALGPPPIAVEPVLDRYPIKLVFTSEQAPFQAILNALANPNYAYFMVVRQVRVENTSQEAPLKEEVKSKLQQLRQVLKNPATPAAPVNPNGLVGPAPAPPDAVTIMGAELLQVYLDVDFIRFREPAKENKPAAAKK